MLLAWLPEAEATTNAMTCNYDEPGKSNHRIPVLEPNLIEFNPGIE
jgi:hypothetical protein